MIKEIIRDQMFLQRVSTKACKNDLQVATDLLDTLKANKDRCVGLAANMIGVDKRIIAVSLGFIDVVLFNPSITKKSEPYITEEGCLSLDGVRQTTRYKKIEVEFYDKDFKKHTQKYEGFTAQIIQHEIDHCDGILI